MAGLLQLTSYNMILIVGTLISFILTTYICLKRDEFKYYTILLFSLCILLNFIGEVGENVFIPFNIKILFNSFTALSAGFIPFLWLLFILDYINQRELLKNKIYLGVLLIVPLIYFFAGLTNPWLHLLWAYTPMIINGESILLHGWGIISAIYYIYTAIAFLISIYYIIKVYMESKISKSTTYALISAELIVIIGIFLRFVGITNYNTVPISMIICLSIFVYLLMFNKRFDFSSSIYETFIDNIDVGMLFFNVHDELIDFNPAVLKMTNLTVKSLNKEVYHLFGDDLLNFFYSGKSELVYYVKEKKVWLNIERRSIKNQSSYGRVYIIFNITAIKNAEDKSIKREQELMRLNEELDKSNEMLEASHKKLDIVNKGLEESYEKSDKIHLDLKKSNNEKVVLLKEIHHRVKNNLQIILSLLNLDKRFHSKNPDEILDATANRIKTMALIHEKTYKSDDLVNVDVEEFITDNVDNLSGLYGEQIGLERVDCIIDSVVLPMSVITPMGLILNEFFINTIKYAYVDYPVIEKHICVKFTVDNDIATLIFTDNGKGLPEDIDIHNSPSLGLTIVNSLTEQLSGEFSKLENLDGTGFKISFPISINVEENNKE